uniref:C2 domain-containing protein n=1 Tax=Aegilops tauschii subsp. strangulata TaxID=200361 RepID=A0A453BQ68_AEGTS
RDARGSDPYVVLRLGKQKLKTSVKKRSVNPIWHEELTLSITNPNAPIKRRCLTRTPSARTTQWGTRTSRCCPSRRSWNWTPRASATAPWCGRSRRAAGTASPRRAACAGRTASSSRT